MIKKFLVLFLLLSPMLAPKANGQSRMIFGGNFGITAGDYLNISIAPLVGYRFTPKFSAGVLAKYEYSQDKNVIPPYDANTYGGGVFARYDVTSLFFKQVSSYNIFLHTEYQHLYTKFDIKSQSYSSDSYSEDRWYLGAGFSVPVGTRSSFYTYLAFDMVSLFNDKNSSQPIVSVGYQF